MARIRTIKPEFWTHPVMARLDPHVRLLALALLNHADDHGYFMASPPIVQAACSPFTEDSVRVHGWLTELSRVGWIEVRNHPTHGPIGRVVNFSTHQRVNRPSDSKVKAYWFTEDSVNAHGGLTEDSLLEQGTGNREGNSERKSGADAPPTGGLVEVDPDDVVGTPAKITPPPTKTKPPISLMDWKAHGHGRVVITRDNREEWEAMWRHWSEVRGWTIAWQTAYDRCADQPKIWPNVFQTILDELEANVTETEDK